MNVRKRQARLQKIAQQIDAETLLSPEDRDFLVRALVDISNGVDAETALKVKAKRGERKGSHARDMKIVMQYVHGFIAVAIAPQQEGGMGLTLKDAVELVHKNWPGLPSKATIIRYWNNVRKSQSQEFTIKTD